MISLCFLSIDSLKTSNGWRERQIVVAGSSEIILDDAWFVEGTITLIHDRDTLSDAEWLWNDSLKVLYATPAGVHAGDTLTLIWRSAAVTDRSTYFYYQPSNPDTLLEEDRIASLANKSISNKHPFSDWSGLRRSGTLVRGVRFGSAGDSGSASGLHLELSGRPAPGVEVEAVVDDRSLGGRAGGTSTTLSELDRLYITAATPHLNGTLGDWDLSWKEGEYGQIERRLKGGRIGVVNRKTKLEVVAAGGNSRFTSLILSGRAGDQGPYELATQFGNVGVSIVAGSERVSLNGRVLRRGLDADYSIDYDRGAILFHPTISIRDRDRIEVAYEYSDDAYAKRFLAAKGSTAGSRWSMVDGRWAMDYLVAEEGRDEDNPLSFEWTPELRAKAAAAGDDRRGAVTSGIIEVGIGLGDYIWGRDAAGDSILVFSPPDSSGRPTGYLSVDFAADSSGGYQRSYHEALLTFTYRWAGVGNGGYSPARSIPLPDRTRLAVGMAGWSDGGYSTTLEAAVSDFDQNTLSSIGDNNNRGAAFNWQGGWSRADSTLKTRVKVKHEGGTFRTLSRIEPVDFRHHWGIAGKLPERPETSVEARIELQPIEDMRISGDYGRLERGADFTGSRLGLVTRVDRKSLRGEIYLEHLATTRDLSAENASTDRLTGSIGSQSGVIQPRLQIRVERQAIDVAETLSGGYRLYQADPGLGFKAADWGEFEIDYMLRRDEAPVSGEFLTSSDARSLKLGWQGITGLSQWRSIVQRSLQTFADPSVRPLRSTSAAVTTIVGGFSSPLRFSGDYRLSSGNTRSEVWVASYLGEGRGGYRLEGDRYVPDPDGQFDLQRVVTDEIEFASTVEFAGRLEWRLGPSARDAASARYPFGISKTMTRFEAEAVTNERDPLATFLLGRTAFRSPLVKRSRWNWRQEIEFLDSDSPGDGRLTLRRDESRDKGISGGEQLLLESLFLRLRFQIATQTSLQLLPLIERQRRWEIPTSSLRSNVMTTGSDVELNRSSASTRWETSVKLGREVRRDEVSGLRVDEIRLQPLLLRRFGEQGSGRLEGEWRRLTSTPAGANYDLLRGWQAGENYSANFSLDYRIGVNLSATASLRSRWRPRRAPLHSALVEMTATL